MLAGLKSHRLYEPALLGEIYAFIKPHIETAKYITKEVHFSLKDNMNNIRITKTYDEYKCMSNNDYYELCYSYYLTKSIFQYGIKSSDNVDVNKFIISHLNYQTKNITCRYFYEGEKIYYHITSHIK